MRSFVAWTALLVGCADHRAAPPIAGPAPRCEVIDASQWQAAVTRILPAGAAITRVTPGVVPDGWISEDACGLELSGTSGADAFQIWIMPRDWIGIRRPDPARVNRNYWDGILANDAAITIAISTATAIPEAMRGLEMSTPSLVNGGAHAAAERWRGRFDSADGAAATLIATHCADPAARDEAVYSLVVLGVPAAGVFRTAALAARGRAKEFAISALAQFPGDETTQAIAAVLVDPTTPDNARGYAAQVAEQLAAPSLGQALATALALTADIDVRTKIIRAIARVRYLPAAPAVYEAMVAERNESYRADISEALATLRYTRAIDSIRRLADDPIASELAGWQLEDIRAKAHRSLFVLTGTWGEPADGWRFALDAKPGATHATLYIENVSDQMLSYFTAIGGTVVVDGVAHPQPVSAIDGVDSFWPNQVYVVERDLSPWLTTKGVHRVRYVVGNAASNELVVHVGD